jgi:hypothetical protein
MPWLSLSRDVSGDKWINLAHVIRLQFLYEEEQVRVLYSDGNWITYTDNEMTDWCRWAHNQVSSEVQPASEE